MIHTDVGDRNILDIFGGAITQGIMVSEAGVWWGKKSGKIHAEGLPGMGFLEASLKVIKGRLSIGARGFLGEVEGTLRVIMVLRARTYDIRI